MAENNVTRPVSSGSKNALRAAWLILAESARSFSLNKQLETAATLAFYGFLSLMPLLLIVIYLLGHFLNSSDEALAAVRSVTHSLFPAFNEEILQDLLRLSAQRAWGVISVVLLMWSMTPFAGAVRHSLHQIFKSDRKIHFVKAKLLDLAAVFALMLLFVFLAALRVIFQLNESAPAFLRTLVPLLACVAVFVFFYAAFAPGRTRVGHLLAGALTATVLLVVIRPLFGLLLQFNPNYGYAFGSLKAIFLLLIWVYYTFAVILLGAEVMANARRYESLILRGLFTGHMAASGLVRRFIRELAPGEVLFREGEGGDQMYYVLRGGVDLRIGGEVIKTSRPGDYFGEMSMLIHAPRSATAGAGSDGAELVTISQQNFESILRENPEIVSKILHEMALRLKATNEKLAEKKGR